MFGTERTNARRVTLVSESYVMLDDAEYLRAQARLCLDMSRHMSALSDRAHFERQAAEYTLRAEQIERAPAIKDGTQ